MKRRLLGILASGACFLAGLTLPAQAEQQQDFPTWLESFKADALSKGIHQETLDSALGDIQPIDRVLELDRRQPEFTLTFQQYLAHVVTPARVKQGQKLLAANKTLLTDVSRKYHVPAKVIVAMWGIETDYGHATGGFSVVPALATLAYDGRRSQYFRGELVNALKILDNGSISAKQMRGSWAGAMGQCQFMPSTYLRYAQDWSGSGSPDIWGKKADVFASAANYLSQLGWNSSVGWGRRVKLPKTLDPALIGLTVKKSYKDWNKLGVRQSNGKPLPKSAVVVSLVRAETGKGSDVGHGTPYLVTDNFRAYMSWNRSTFFALAAGMLADQIASR